MKRGTLLQRRQSVCAPRPSQNTDGSISKRSAILYNAKKSRAVKKSNVEDSYFDNPSLAFLESCCFLSLPDIKLAKVRSRSIWLKDDHAIAFWTSNKKSKSLPMGFCTLAKYFMGSTKENRVAVATDFFEMLDSNFFGSQLSSKLTPPKECNLATGHRGYLLYQDSKLVVDEFWMVEFLESAAAPFKLELHITASNTPSGVYSIDQRDLKGVLFGQQLASSDKFAEDSAGDIFMRLMDGLVFDSEFGTFQVDVIELQRMHRHMAVVMTAEQDMKIAAAVDQGKLEKNIRDAVNRLNTLEEEAIQQVIAEASANESDGSRASSAASTPQKRNALTPNSKRGIIDHSVSNALEVLDEQERSSPSKKDMPPKPANVPRTASKMIGFDAMMRKIQYQRPHSDDSGNSFASFESLGGEDESGPPKDDILVPEDDVMPFQTKDDVDSYYTMTMNAASRAYVLNQMEGHMVRQEVYLRNLMKSGAAEVTAADSMRYGDSRNKSGIYPAYSQKYQGPLLMHLRESLKTPPRERGEGQVTMILQMLLMTRGLSEYLEDCSEDEVLSISNACSLANIAEKGEVLANREENIVLRGRISLCKPRRVDIGDAIDLHDSEYPDSNVDTTRRAMPPSKYRYKIVQEIRSGAFVGTEYWRGRLKWKYDVVSSSVLTSVCVIPIQALMRYVGYVGARPIDMLGCFWKYHGLWTEAQKSSKELSIQYDKDIDLTRELTENSHIRHYWPGEQIFTEGVARRYMYIVSVGECAYTRRFPPKKVKLTVPTVPIYVDVNIGLNLFAGHYSFMDGCMAEKFVVCDEDSKFRLPTTRSQTYYNMLGGGENGNLPEVFDVTDFLSLTSAGNGDDVIPDHNWSEWKKRIMKKENRAKPLGVKNSIHSKITMRQSSLRESSHKHRRRSSIQQATCDENQEGSFPDDEDGLFGQHMNSLVAVTFCEVCVISLNQLYHCPRIFNQLLAQTQQRYPLTAIEITELVDKYQQNLTVTEVLEHRKVVQNDESANQERLLLPQCREQDITSIRHVNDVKRRKEDRARVKAYAKTQRDMEAEHTKLVNVKHMHFNYGNAGQKNYDRLVIDHTPLRSPVRRPISGPPSRGGYRQIGDRSPIGSRHRTFRTAL